MTRRSVLALVGVVGVGLLAAGCGDGAGAPDETTRDAPTLRTTGSDGEVEDPAKTTGSAELAVADFAVEGMSCGGCALATEMAVRKLDGVASTDADYDESTDEGSCTVEYDPSVVTPERIARAIREAGFEPRLREGGSG